MHMALALAQFLFYYFLSLNFFTCTLKHESVEVTGIGSTAPDKGPDSISSLLFFSGESQTGSPETIHHAQHAQALSIYSGAKTDPYYVQ